MSEFETMKRVPMPGIDALLGWQRVSRFARQTYSFSLFRLLLIWLLVPAWSLGQDDSQPNVSESEESASLVAEEGPKSAQQNYQIVVEDSVAFVPSLNTVAMKLPMALQVTPASVGVVNESLFSNQDARVMGEALRNVSGVVAHTGFGVFDFFTLRGFDSLTGALVLTDAAPEPEVTFYHLYNVERVEVLKGPSAFLYGGNPLAGGINLVRKQPLLENRNRVEASFGSFETFRGSLDLNRASQSGNLAFRLNAFAQKSAGYREDKSNHQIGVNPAVSLNLGTAGQLIVNAEYVRNEFRPDAGIPLFNNEIPDVDLDRSYQSPFDFSEQDLFRLKVDYQKNVGDKLVLRDKFYYTDLDWPSEGTLFNFAFPNQVGSVDVSRSLLSLDDRQKLVGNQFEALFFIATGPIRHSLLTGFEVSRLTDNFQLDVGLLPNLDLFNPAETASKPFFFLPGQSQSGDAKSLVFAPYFVDQLAIGSHVKLFVGGRWDWVDFEELFSSTQREDGQFSPLFGAVYSPTTSLSIYANSGRAFAPPSTQVVGDFKPEESAQYEFGVKKHWAQGRIHTTVSVFQLERDNIAIPDDNGFTRQTGDQRSRGVEVDFAGQLGDGWHAFLNYSNVSAKLTDFREQVTLSLDPFQAVVLDRSGNQAAFAPENLLNFWIIKELPNGLSLGGGARFIGDQFIAEDNAFQIQSVLRLDASLGYRFESWRLSLNFKNLTNRDYFTRGFGSTSVIPAPPFGVYGRAELGF